MSPDRAKRRQRAVSEGLTMATFNSAIVMTVLPTLRPFLRQALRRTSSSLSSRSHHLSLGRTSGILRQFSQTRHVLASTVPITYVEADGTEKTVDAEIGQNMMQVAHDNDIELEGACGGELACSTCHLIFEQDVYDSLPEKEEEEDDMLDLAFEVTETSRLGCQILVKESFAGTKVKIPDDGF